MTTTLLPTQGKLRNLQTLAEIEGELVKAWPESINFRIAGTVAYNTFTTREWEFIPDEVPLPIEPGFYIDQSKTYVYCLRAGGLWDFDGELRDEAAMRRFAHLPLVRLITVNDVTDWLDSKGWFGAVDELRQHFGVTL